MSITGQILRWSGRALLLAAITLIAAETFLQVSAQLVRDRGGQSPDGRRVTVIGVGDSHMYGAMVKDEESFPAQLESALEEIRPGVFSVTNLGVPGMNTTQVRNRFLENLEVHRPDVVLIWCGINNKWNRSEVDSSMGSFSLIEAYAQRSRLYRMYVVWRHNREIDEGVSTPPGTGRGGATHLAGDGKWTIRHGGREETLDVERYEENRETAQIREHAYRDYRQMTRWAEAAGVKVLFIGYPIEWGYFTPANFAMQDTAAETSALYLDTRNSFQHLPTEDTKLLPGAHPTAAMYGEFARIAAPVIIQTAGWSAAPATQPALP